MLAAALPVTGGFGRGVGACALRLQNDCFVWLCAPVSAPRPRDRCARLAAACAALCSRGCCGWCAHSGGCTFLHTFHFIFLPAPLDTRLSLCYNHRRTDGVRLDRFHFITKRRDLSSAFRKNHAFCKKEGTGARFSELWNSKARCAVEKEMRSAHLILRSGCSIM